MGAQDCMSIEPWMWVLLRSRGLYSSVTPHLAREAGSADSGEKRLERCDHRCNTAMPGGKPSPGVQQRLGSPAPPGPASLCPRSPPWPASDELHCFHLAGPLSPLSRQPAVSPALLGPGRLPLGAQLRGSIQTSLWQ